MCRSEGMLARTEPDHAAVGRFRLCRTRAEADLPLSGLRPTMPLRGSSAHAAARLVRSCRCPCAVLRHRLGACGARHHRNRGGHRARANRSVEVDRGRAVRPAWIAHRNAPAGGGGRAWRVAALDLDSYG
jgi:hypothetical protein